MKMVGGLAPRIVLLQKMEERIFFIFKKFIYQSFTERKREEGLETRVISSGQEEERRTRGRVISSGIREEKKRMW